MSIVDKVIAAITPPESEDKRAEARMNAMAAATTGDWLSQVLEHHLQLEDAFAAVKDARDAASRTEAQKWLGLILTGHATAEESILYPALTEVSEKGHAMTGYTEQAMVKIQMALLENLAPMSQEYLDKLEHIRGAVVHHMYEEESNWFIELKRKAPPAVQNKLTARYMEEFKQYVGENAMA